MNTKIKFWIKSMNWCSKYWGCHQLPERSFFVNGYQFPVCARCMGIAIGYIIAILLRIAGVITNPLICIVMVLPTTVDGSMQYITSYQSNNIKRLLTGIAFGYGFMQLLICLVVLILETIIL